jgi:hypothetical protein
MWQPARFFLDIYVRINIKTHPGAPQAGHWDQTKAEHSG